MKKYVLLDRDGTIIVNKHYQKDPAITELEPNAAAGLAALRDAGFGLVLLSNQSGIGRGRLTAEDVDAVNASMVRLLGGGAGFFDGIYYCPHVESDDCGCRKPAPGLAVRAASELGFALEDSYVVGDREIDVQLGETVGAATVLVRTGYGVTAEGLCAPEYVADDLLDAARWILTRAAYPAPAR